MDKEQKKSPMAEDWDKDAFPTSAKPVYRAAAVLILLVLTLCYAVYQSSEHPEEAQKENKKLKIESKLLADEQLIE